jgi:choline kinase
MDRIKKAVIVAAGLSSRLYPLTLDRPKGLLEVGGATILSRSVRLLKENGIENILVVVGYLHEQIRKALGPEIEYRLNPFFAGTNNMGSLWFARDWVAGEPFLYLHSDILYEGELLRSVIDGDWSDAAMLVEDGPTDEEAMKVRIEDGRFIESNKGIPIEEAYGEWVGIAAFRNPEKLFCKIEGLLERKEFQAYDTLAFTEMTAEGVNFAILPTNKLRWIEVDDNPDIDRARELFK